MRSLTDRDHQVLVELLRGRSEKEAGVALGMRPSTVHNHVKAIYRSYEVSSRSELLSLWIERMPDGSSGAASRSP